MIEQTTVTMEKEVVKKLRAISAKTGIPQSQILEDFVKALFQLIDEGLEETHRVSLTTWEINLLNSTIRINASPIFTLTELPSSMQDEVLEAFGYTRGSRGELIDTREKPTEETKESDT